MVKINKLMKREGSGCVSIPKDELQMCGLIGEDGAPKSDIQLLVEMTEPGEWRITVMDDDVVEDSWYNSDQTPDTGVSVGAAGGR